MEDKYTRVEDIKDKTHKAFTTKLLKAKIPCTYTGIIRNKAGAIRFIEVILNRKERYANPQILKKIPRNYRGIKIKVF